MTELPLPLVNRSRIGWIDSRGTKLVPDSSQQHHSSLPTRRGRSTAAPAPEAPSGGGGGYGTRQRRGRGPSGGGSRGPSGGGFREKKWFGLKDDTLKATYRYMMDGSHGTSADRSMRYVFILDSGASVHCTGDKYLLSDYRNEVMPYRYLIGASGKQMNVHGTGSIRNDKFQVKDVLYVPDLNCKTIFSVGKLHEHHLSIVFNHDGTSSVIDMKWSGFQGEIVGKARNADGLFMLDYLRVPPYRDPLPMLEGLILMQALWNVFLLVWSSITWEHRPPHVSGRAVAARLDAAIEGEQAVLAAEVVQPEVAEVCAQSYKGSGTESSNRAVQLETGESSRVVATLVKERTADGVKGKSDVVKVDQLREERTKAVVFEAQRETTAAVVQAIAESSSQITDYLISPSPNRPLKRTITSWTKGQHLSSGSFGSVYEAISDDGFFFAVKEVSLVDQGLNAKECILQLEHEISLLSRLDHENIVQYFGTDKEDGKLYIFLELVTQGSLAVLYQKYHLQESQVSAYTKQILNGLHYLHKRNVLHRDIKCANILVDVSGVVKLADFGLAKEISILNQTKSSKGTFRWMAPEVAKAKPYGPPADIWSLGCTVLEMLTGKLPYPDMECVCVVFNIGKGIPPEIPDTLSEDARDFIKKCVQVNPNDRPSAAQLFKHPFVQRLLQQYGT